MPEVCRRVGYSVMHIWRLEQAGKFPGRIHLGPNSVGWLEAWIKERLAARDHTRSPSCALCGRKADEVRQLVAGASGSICDECIDVAQRTLLREEA